jgi:hypothetical protein
MTRPPTPTALEAAINATRRSFGNDGAASLAETRVISAVLLEMLVEVRLIREALQARAPLATPVITPPKKFERRM